MHFIQQFYKIKKKVKQRSPEYCIRSASILVVPSATLSSSLLLYECGRKVQQATSGSAQLFSAGQINQNVVLFCKAFHSVFAEFYSVLFLVNSNLFTSSVVGLNGLLEQHKVPNII